MSQTINMRLKFTKGNEVKYISHLDLMRTFQRAIRRSGIPIAYSSGFNPHQEISFGAPLSLGVTSDAEYVDIKLAESISPEEVKERLNATLPQGIKILGSALLPDKAKNAMSIVTHARYIIRFLAENTSTEALQESLQNFFAQETITALKKQPKKDFEMKEINIKPMIVNMKMLRGDDDEYFLSCLLLSGSQSNLKPELMMTAFKDFTGLSISGIKINREETYVAHNGRLMDLLEYSKFEGKPKVSR